MLQLPDGIRHLPHFLSRAEQEDLVGEIRNVVAAAPLFIPQMPRTGQPMSVRMTNCGPLGWVTDKEKGYRYQATHPETGVAWPPMPHRLLELWRHLTRLAYDPEACLVNFYSDEAKMGLHQDRDEAELAAPVLSISLGNSCLFRIGGPQRKDRTQSFRLDSGDIVLLGGPSRLNFHGVDRIYPETSDLLKKGGRINLTLRRVTPATP
ncbi:alpha-ketoglutarate-dependent dioxygenase AlkB family protein [Gellertiella hungarica]|uniref:Alkylated DNA repair protein (DNA oxidative demethylase) n=1 Tax=Gellertiella hungarica TaxID=1572859 RepID=A0A7W6JAL1_9HYPH|nr:alpha-ketoglutarate-dependent dioxygenase AlkB [Gellertiella hungarica]MBB4066891.1 alkylated DNA repair protein (DNA oxidative demethylase) [Gellertiella hungarica]